MTFQVVLKNNSFSFRNPREKEKLQAFAKKNPDMPCELVPLFPESKKHRGWLEAAVIPMVTFFEEDMDHRDDEDNKTMRDLLKDEFWSENKVRLGKLVKVKKSTRGRIALNNFTELCLNWMGENGYPIQYLDSEGYFEWRDTIFPLSKPTDPDNYISYLESMGKIKKRFKN